MPLAAFADDIPEPNGVPMGPAQNGDPDAHMSEHTGESDNAAIGSAGAAAAEQGDESDQNAVGSEFDGSRPAGGDDTPTEPGGTNVEPNGDPQ